MDKQMDKEQTKAILRSSFDMVIKSANIAMAQVESVGSAGENTLDEARAKHERALTSMNRFAEAAYDLADEGIPIDSIILPVDAMICITAQLVATMGGGEAFSQPRKFE